MSVFGNDTISPNKYDVTPPLDIGTIPHPFPSIRIQARSGVESEGVRWGGGASTTLNRLNNGRVIFEVKSPIR